MGLEGEKNNEPEKGDTRTTEAGGKWKYNGDKWVPQGFEKQTLKGVTIEGNEASSVSALDLRGLNWLDEAGYALEDELLPRISEDNIMDFDKSAPRKKKKKITGQSKESKGGYSQYFPARFTFGGDVTGAYGPYGVAHCVKLNWLLKGKDASWWPYLTAESGPAVGYELGAEVVAGPQWYLQNRGKYPILQRRMSGSAFNLGGSASGVAGELSYGMKRNVNVSNPFWFGFEGGTGPTLFGGGAATYT